MAKPTMAGAVRQWIGRWIAAWLFYTAIPLPAHWPVQFQAIARLAPLVGVVIGVGLGALDWGLAAVGLPVWPRMALVVAVGIWITGGLHLDGAMDTADGLAVMEPERRLAVMADSVVGAFGAIAVVVIVLLKVTALGSLAEGDHWWALGLAMGWGRWGQLMAIAQYPYLKAEGKGKFHRTEIQGWQEGLGPGLGLLVLSTLAAYITGNGLERWLWFGGISLGNVAIALGTGAWFNHQLGGHTGDTYGAVVEWTESLILLWCTLW